jgi:thioredoxin-related protein
MQLLFNPTLFAQINPTLNIGQEMPMENNIFIDVNEKSMSLNDNLKANGLLVIFTSNKCPFVVMWEDRYALLETRCKESDIGMVYINSNHAKRDGDDSIEEMKRHAYKMSYSFPYLIDIKSEIANSFGAKTTPHIFLFNRNKKLVYKGAIDDNYNSIDDVESEYLLNALEEMFNQKSISLVETRAVGCSIKRVKNNF